MVPTGLGAIEGRSVGTVSQLISASFVHTVVRHQVAFVTRQVLHVGSGYLFLRQGLCPNACFHNIAVKLTTELQRCGTAKHKIFRQGIKAVCCKRLLLRSDIKFHFLLVVVIHRYHTAEDTVRQHVPLGEEHIDIHFIDQEERQASFTASHLYRIVAIRHRCEEQRPHRLSIMRANEHIDRKGLVCQRTLHLRHGFAIYRIREMQTRTGRDTRGIGHADDLEVIVHIQVVSRDRFVEAQFEVVAYTEDSIRRLSCSEHTRCTGVFRSADDGRALGDKA